MEYPTLTLHLIVKWFIYGMSSEIGQVTKMSLPFPSYFMANEMSLLLC